MPDSAVHLILLEYTMNKLCIYSIAKTKITRKGDLKLVENNGVEPMTSCMPCKRSSQLS